MKRIALPSLLVVACVACGDQTIPVEPERAAPQTVIAASHNPNRPADVEYTIDAEGFCPFVVRFEVSGKEKTIELPGRTHTLPLPRPQDRRHEPGHREERDAHDHG